MDEQLIARIPLFASLPPSEISHLLKTLRRVEVPSDTLLFSEGDHGDRFYIIVEGQLDVIKALDTEEERLLSTRGPGSYLGEMSFLVPNGLRTASVRTRTPVQLLEMTRDDFDRLLHRWPTLAYEMAQSLSRRLCNSDNAAIRDLQEKNRQLAEAYANLQAAQAQIIEKERMERELQVAWEIQQSILPRFLPTLPGFDFGARIVPSRVVGGDFFDFIPLDKNNLGIAVGDVSDKGVPAAIFMAMTRSLVRAEAKRAKSPQEALRGVNEHLVGMNDAGMFVTVLYGVLNKETCTFDYARAGHTLPILCVEGGEAYTPAFAAGQPLGIFPDPALDVQKIVLSRGGVLLLYTDGMTDAVDSAGEFFGQKRLQKTLVACCNTSAQKVCDRMVQAVSDYQKGVPPYDDVALVAVKVGVGEVAVCNQ